MPDSTLCCMGGSFFLLPGGPVAIRPDSFLARPVPELGLSPSFSGGLWRPEGPAWAARAAPPNEFHTVCATGGAGTAGGGAMPMRLEAFLGTGPAGSGSGIISRRGGGGGTVMISGVLPAARRVLGAPCGSIILQAKQEAMGVQ